MVSLARQTASASSVNRSTVITGPKTSSRTMRMWLPQSVNSVGR